VSETPLPIAGISLNRHQPAHLDVFAARLVSELLAQDAIVEM
jgi:hypothetical protein